MMGNITVKLPCIRPYFSYTVFYNETTTNKTNITKSFLSVVALHSLVKGYGMILQIILNFEHLYLVLKMSCTSI